MKKYTKRLLCWFFALWFCLCLPSGTIRAVETEADLFYNTEQQDIMMHVAWKVKDAFFTIISPDGTEIDPMVASETVSSIVSDEGMFVIIRNAAIGQWKWRYDKGSNELLEVSISNYKEPVWIDAFKTGVAEGTMLPFSIETNSDEDRLYNYAISIRTDATGAVSKVIYNGTGVANTPVEGSVDLSEINTYGSYLLEVRVYYMEDGLEYFDIAQSAPFSYTNPKQVEGVRDFELIVDEAAGSVSVGNVTYPLGWSDEILVRIYAGDQVIQEEAYTSDTVSECLVFFPEDTNELKIGLTLVSGGLLSSEVLKTCSLLSKDTDFNLLLPDFNLTNQKMVPISYVNAKDQEVKVTLNEMEDLWTLQGSGEKLIEIKEGNSQLTFEYTDTNHVTRRKSISLSLDMYPPFLNILDHFDGMVTSEDSLIIAGETEVGATVTVNGVAIEVKEAGTFLYTYSLNRGENKITIVSKDINGNETAYYAAVKRGPSDSGIGKIWSQYYPLILSLLASILGVGLIIAAAVKKKKKEKNAHPEKDSREESQQ